jgi:hypothetical protein
MSNHDREHAMGLSSRAAAVAAGLMAAASLALAAPAVNTNRYSMDVLAELPCEQAVARVNEGLQANDREASFALGQMQDEGFCVTRNAAKALQSWRAAAEAGHVQAMTSLALKFGQGEGVVQDYAAAGDWLRKAGVRVGGVDFPDSYNLGYAYTWLRLTKREMASVKELATLGARGTADVEFDPRQGVAQAVSFRRTDGGEAQVGTRIDRSRTVVKQAVSQAADAARGKLAKPDAARLADLRFRELFGIAPGADYEDADLSRTIGPAGLIRSVGGVVRN